jgi:hypothetical protein
VARVALSQDKVRDASAGALIGGVTGAMTGAGFTEGAIAGAAAGGAGVAKLVRPGMIRAVANTAGRPVAGTTAATALALQNLSGTTSRQIVAETDQKIQRAIAQGQPSYAATFTALQSPEVRVAVKNVDEEDINTDEVEEDTE